MTQTTSFYDNIKDGTKGEKKFIELYFKPRGMDYKDVSDDPYYRNKDIDFVSEGKTYEVKYNYKNDKNINIEEYTNINEDLANISKGWIYKSKADILVIVSQIDDTIILFNLPELQLAYDVIKDNYKLLKNKVSTKNDESWQSAFRVIPLKDLEGLYLEI